MPIIRLLFVLSLVLGSSQVMAQTPAPYYSAYAEASPGATVRLDVKFVGDGATQIALVRLDYDNTFIGLSSPSPIAFAGGYADCFIRSATGFSVLAQGSPFPNPLPSGVTSVCRYTVTVAPNAPPGLIPFTLQPPPPGLGPSLECIDGTGTPTNCSLSSVGVVIGPPTGPALYADSPAAGSITPVSGGTLGEAAVTSEIQFLAADGTPSGLTTTLTCSDNDNGTEIVANGSQSVGSFQVPAPVQVAFTPGTARLVQVTCIATPQNGGAVKTFVYSYDVAAGEQRDQTIMLDAPVSQTYAPNGLIAVVGSASSGLPVTLASSTPAICTALGSTLVIGAAGDCHITADQPGNVTYRPAPQVSATIRINPASQFIIFNDPAAQGATPGSVLNLDASASSGLTVSFASLTEATCSVSGNQATILAAGVCRLLASQPGDGNYLAATPVEREVNSSKTNQTITFAQPPSQTYAPGGSFALSVSGGASNNPVVVTSTTPSVCSVSDGQQSFALILAAGNCQLVANQAGNDNFNAAPQETRDVSIGRATQTVVIDEPGAQYFAPGRPFQVTASAFSNGVATGLPVVFSAQEQCIVTGNTFTLLDRGTCTFVATQDGNANYQAAPAAVRNIPISIATTVSDVDARETFASSSDDSGRYVVYRTADSESDIYRLDTLTLTRERVDVDNAETPVSGAAIEAMTAGDGQRVVFVAPEAGVVKLLGESKAARAKRIKTGGHGVFLRNLIAGTTQRVGAALPNGSGTTPQLAANGQSVVFTAMAPNGKENVYVAAVLPNGMSSPVCVSCKSVASNGQNTSTDSDDASGNPVLSRDGTWIAFETRAKNLLAGSSDPCPSATTQIVLRNIVTGLSQRIGAPASASNCSSGGSRKPSIDHAGGKIVFESDLPLSGGDNNGATDIFLVDVGSSGVRRISQSDNGAQGNAASTSATISGDGTTIAFASGAQNLDASAPDTGSVEDVHIAVITPSRPFIINRLNRQRSDQLADANARRPALNYSGTKLLFDSTGGNAATNVNPGALRVFQQATPLNLDKVFYANFE